MCVYLPSILLILVVCIAIQYPSVGRRRCRLVGAAAGGESHPAYPFDKHQDIAIIYVRTWHRMELSGAEKLRGKTHIDVIYGSRDMQWVPQQVPVGMILIISGDCGPERTQFMISMPS